MRKDEIRCVIDVLVYWTDCNIATFEMVMSKKSTSQADRRRYGNIARGMVEHVKQFGCAPAGSPASLEPFQVRLRDELKQLEDRLKRAEQVVP